MARVLAVLSATAVCVWPASCGGESDATFPGPDGEIELDRPELTEALEVIISSELYTPRERVPVLKAHTSCVTGDGDGIDQQWDCSVSIERLPAKGGRERAAPPREVQLAAWIEEHGAVAAVQVGGDQVSTTGGVLSGGAWLLRAEHARGAHPVRVSSAGDRKLRHDAIGAISARPDD